MHTHVCTSYPSAPNAATCTPTPWRRACGACAIRHTTGHLIATRNRAAAASCTHATHGVLASPTSYSSSTRTCALHARATHIAPSAYTVTLFVVRSQRALALTPTSLTRVVPARTPCAAHTRAQRRVSTLPRASRARSVAVRAVRAKWPARTLSRTLGTSSYHTSSTRMCSCTRARHTFQPLYTLFVVRVKRA